MAVDPNHARDMFERYLYDYLIKRNMHQTAEIFRIQANLHFDPNEPLAIDVPEGFLLEWWTSLYACDSFRELVHMHVAGNATSNMDWERQRFDATQGSNAPQEEQYHHMNAEGAMDQLPDNFTPTINIENNSAPSYKEEISEVPLLYLPASHREVYCGLSQLLLPPPYDELIGESSQFLLPSPHGEEELLTPINVANASGQEILTLQTEINTAFDEEKDPLVDSIMKTYRKIEQDYKELFDNWNLGESSKNEQEGNNGMNGFAGCTSLASKDADNRSETSECSSTLQTGTSTTTADASLVDQLENPIKRDKSVSSSME